MVRVRMMVIAASALLAGCVDSFYSDVAQYKGRNIEALIGRIGEPDSQTFIAGHVVYTWPATNSGQPAHSFSMHAPPAGAPGAADNPLQPSSIQPGDVTPHLRCALKVDTDGAGNILSLTWQGQPGSCTP